MASKIKEKQDLLGALQAHMNQIQALGVRRLGVFGSFVNGQPDDHSDVDLLVEFEAGKKTFDNFIGLSLFLEDLLERPVELVTRESLSPYIGPRILAQVEYVAVAGFALEQFGRVLDMIDRRTIGRGPGHRDCWHRLDNEGRVP